MSERFDKISASEVNYSLENINENVENNIDELMNFQHLFQQIVNPNWDSMTNKNDWKEISNEIVKQFHYMNMEIAELSDFLFFKSWKDYSNVIQKDFIVTNENDIVYELVDILFFYLNICNLILNSVNKTTNSNIKLSELYNSKLKSNIERVMSGNFVGNKEKVKYLKEKLLK